MKPDELFDGVPPDRATYVLGQAIPFNPQQWKKRLGSWPAWVWPDVLDQCPVQGGWPVVDRRTVFGMAQDLGTAEGRFHLLLATLVWGTGTKAINVARRAAIFENEMSWVDQRLEAAVHLLRDGDLLAAYQVLNAPGKTISHFATAYFTKFLYFAGWEHAGEDKPLIMDSNIVKALRKIEDPEAPGAVWPDHIRQHSSVYLAYVRAAQRWAALHGTEPDVVERRLFQLGKG
ncbi:hypothetical protein [Streptomyces sp. NPDC056707]|uniref:8-oxoguanine DNA glycosylase OGG fold protein n=1 Tax=Streptomyces sp. NPDC056707 TaxID=3345919 RepID=UPI0036BD0367